MINVKLLGKPVYSVDGTDITVKLSRKGVALLSYMLTANKQYYSRAYLASLLWYSGDKSSGLANLRYTIWKVRKVFEDVGLSDVIVSKGRNEVSINRVCFEVDLDVFNNDIISSNNAGAGSLIDSAGVYNGDFMDNFLVFDALEYNDWLFNTREELQLRYFDIQCELADEFIKLGNIDGAKNEYKKLIKIDPLNEEVYCRLINMFITNGNRVAAMKYYKKIKELLREELNISPNAQLKNLYDLIVEEKHQEQRIKKIVPPVIIRNNNKKIRLHNDVNLVSKLTEIEGIRIDIGKLPGKRILYEGIFEVLGVLERFLGEEEKKILYTMKNHRNWDDYSLFSQVANLIKSITSDELCIIMFNLEYMDDKTIDFISFLYRYPMDTPLDMILVYEKRIQNTRMDEFIQAFGF